MGLFTALRKELDLLEEMVEAILDSQPHHKEIQQIARIQNDVERMDAMRAYAESLGIPVLKCPECGSYHYTTMDPRYDLKECEDCGVVFTPMEPNHAAAVHLAERALDSPALRDLERLGE